MNIFMCSEWTRRYCMLWCLSAFVLFHARPSDARRWQSGSGKFSVEASFRSLEKGIVTLKRDVDGKEIRVPLDKLHFDDQRWVMEETGWGRVWATVDGQKFVANLATAKGDRVSLELADGRVVAQALDQLVASDRRYVTARMTEDYVKKLAKTDEFQGKVVSVIDGDTLTVLVEKYPIKVRLEGIDAPEKGQAFSNKSKQLLSKLTFGKTIKVQVTSLDRYGRIIGVIPLKSGSVNSEIVRLGLAWHYTQFSDNRQLARLQQEAKLARIGIWSEPAPVAPWDWRRWGPAEKRKWLSSQSPTASSSSDQPRSELTHWLSANSGVRHNSSCRWFGNSKGRKCDAGEGRACKICGG